MEKITDYKFKDFIQLDDVNLIDEYMMILEYLKPITEIKNPKYNKFKWWSKEPIKIQLPSFMMLTFSEVIEIRDSFNNASIDSILDVMVIVTKLEKRYIERFTITQFYGIINYIKEQLEFITNIEMNELNDDEEDIDLITVNANERMAKFGVINTIDSLANGDLTKWDDIQKMQYSVVFTKLKMDKEKNKIQKEISELQKKRLKN